MSTYAMLSLKGGSGKTTSAMHLAACAVAEGRPVTVIDADEERSALQWAAGAAMPFDAVPADRDGLARQVRELAKDKARVIIVDSPPNDREVLNKAGMLADVVIVPVVPTGLDMDRLKPTLELLRDLEAMRGKLAVGILLCRWDGRTVLAREAIDVLRDFPVLKAKIRGLQVYAQAFGSAPSYLDEYRAAWKELRA